MNPSSRTWTCLTTVLYLRLILCIRVYTYMYGIALNIDIYIALVTVWAKQKRLQCISVPKKERLKARETSKYIHTYIHIYIHTYIHTYIHNTVVHQQW